jgi:hypothetical protein
MVAQALAAVSSKAGSSEFWNAEILGMLTHKSSGFSCCGHRLTTVGSTSREVYCFMWMHALACSLASSATKMVRVRVHAAKGVLLWVVCCFSQIGGLLFGYDIGASSGVLVSLSSPTLSGTDW